MEKAIRRSHGFCSHLFLDLKNQGELGCESIHLFLNRFSHLPVSLPSPTSLRNGYIEFLSKGQE